ncbi:MAG: hypothetical protein ACRD4B_06670, partial [Acidobacteriota bacterium]
MPGKYVTALNFDGVNDYINAGSATSLDDLDNSLTISAWIYPRETISETFGGRIVDKRAPGWALFLRNTNTFKFHANYSTTDLEA